MFHPIQILIQTQVSSYFPDTFYAHTVGHIILMLKKHFRTDSVLREEGLFSVQ